MLSRNELKNQGLQYLRKLQVVVRTAAIFSPEHQAAVVPLQQAFDALHALLRDGGKLTVGFADERALINSIVTTDKQLAQLAAEFAKRNLGTVTVEPGITLARFKKLVTALAVPTKTLEEAGGTNAYLDQNRIEGVRILTADALDLDSEGLSRGGGGMGGGLSLGGLELLLDSAGMRMPEPAPGGPAEIMRMITPILENNLSNPQGDTQKACGGLARMLEDLQPDFVSAYFPPERQEPLKAAPPEQVAVEFVEDTAAHWAARRLSEAPEGPGAIVVEEQVLNGLLRALVATQMADRLARKLADYVKQYAIPKSSYERIQDELRWVAIPQQHKQARLMERERYDAVQFRRFLELLKELVAQSRLSEATDLANHYFDFLDSPQTEVLPEELSRAAEVIEVMRAVRGGFAARTAERLAEALLREHYNEMLHFQVANCLGVLSKSVADYEDYAVVQGAGTALERSLARAPAAHVKCCAGAMKNLLSPTAVERVIELYLQKRDDFAWTRTAGMLVRWVGTSAAESAFHRLEDEQNTSSRLALLRLMAQTGPAAVAVACRRLEDPRWYVVRNACQMLGGVKDPDLLEHLGPALRHSDERVQQAACTAIIKSRLPQRAGCFAQALPYLGARILEEVLQELTFLKDPVIVPALEHLLAGESGRRHLEKIVQILAITPGETPVRTLGSVLAQRDYPVHVRRLAFEGLRRGGTAAGRTVLAQFAEQYPDDPLAAEYQRSAQAGS
jgi:HEAT repeat protein